MVCVNKTIGGYNETHIFWTNSFSDKSNDVMQKHFFMNYKKQKISLKFNIIIKRK